MGPPPGRGSSGGCPGVGPVRRPDSLWDEAMAAPSGVCGRSSAQDHGSPALSHRGDTETPSKPQQSTLCPPCRWNPAQAPPPPPAPAATRHHPSQIRNIESQSAQLSRASRSTSCPSHAPGTGGVSGALLEAELSPSRPFSWLLSRCAPNSSAWSCTGDPRRSACSRKGPTLPSQPCP